jgi:hypothetical protein
MDFLKKRVSWSHIIPYEIFHGKSGTQFWCRFRIVIEQETLFSDLRRRKMTRVLVFWQGLLVSDGQNYAVKSASIPGALKVIRRGVNPPYFDKLTYN